VDSYLDVFTAQTSLLTQQQTTLNLRVEQMTSNVQLIEVLGGGWDNAQLPSERRLLRNKIPIADLVFKICMRRGCLLSRPAQTALRCGRLPWF
jgi:hypothetical protein